MHVGTEGGTVVVVAGVMGSRGTDLVGPTDVVVDGGADARWLGEAHPAVVAPTIAAAIRVNRPRMVHPRPGKYFLTLHYTYRGRNPLSFDLPRVP